MATPTPPQLGFVAIYNPALATPTASSRPPEDDQIVYYATLKSLSRRRRRGTFGSAHVDALSQAERDERLRQVGLARGVVEFGAGFADGVPVEYVETEKGRILFRELEDGWWLVASINLGRVPLPPRLPTSPTTQETEEKYEYTTRDVKPAALLLQDLLRAHALFLLHHDISLSALYECYRRPRFVALLSRYWDLFLSTWSVALRGNPARDVLGGINVAAGGELGVGVGEEHRGSGEREVLEGLVERVHGVVDLVVSRFGDDEGSPPSSPWLGTGSEPAAEDGVVFSGVGALSRRSLRDVAHWMEDLYTWGENAYGVADGKRGKSVVDRTEDKAADGTAKNQAVQDTRNTPDTSPVRAGASPPQIGTSPVQTDVQSDLIKTDKDSGIADTPVQITDKDAAQIESTTDTNTLETNTHPDTTTNPETNAQETTTHPETNAQETSTHPETTTTTNATHYASDSISKVAGYLRMGYGTYWSLSRASAASTPTPPKDAPKDAGRFLIGLAGGLDDTSDSDEALAARAHHRTLYVEIESSEADVVHNNLASKASPLRVIIYVNRPFIFLFLFHPDTDSLASEPLYQSLHHQLAPLRRPLLVSTAYRPPRPGVAPDKAFGAGIHDLVWDPVARTVHCTIPNIPAYPTKGQWTRAEAISTHAHVLALFAATRPKKGDRDVERSCKTPRGWWIVWTRVGEYGGGGQYDSGGLAQVAEEREGEDMFEGVSEGGSVHNNNPENHPPETNNLETNNSESRLREIFLLRRSSEHAHAHSSSRSRSRSISITSSLASGAIGAVGAMGDVFAERGASPTGEGVGGSASVSGQERGGDVVYGIGVDTRRYIEALLSMRQ